MPPEAYSKGTAAVSATLTKVEVAKSDVLRAASYFDDVVATTRQMKGPDVNVQPDP